MYSVIDQKESKRYRCSVPPHRSTKRFLGLLLVTAVFICTFAIRNDELFAQDPDLATLDRFYGGLLRSDLRIDSAGSCGAAGCHGGPRPGVANATAQRSSEYQLWFENDPHARSWQTICSDASVEMLTRLRIIENDRIVDLNGFNNCLACHSSMPLDSVADLDFENANSSGWQPEGVGCNGCHGPSERWSTNHYASNWKPSDSIEEGFVPAKDLIVRARMCASCHVGDRDRDMNHDIIAAGHPALRFDMATYHNRLPKHWRDQQATDSARFEAQLWAAGAIAGADAWLSLMQGRAQDSNSVSTWPELSAYDCSSCHHDLSLNNQRSPLSDPTQRGLAKQSLWNTYSFTDLLAEKTLPRTKQELTLAQFDAIRNHLEASPSPNPVHLVELVISARQGLASWSVGEEFRPHANRFSTSIVSSFQPDQIAQIALQSATDDRGLSTWETASQNYLLQIASRHSWPVAQRSQLTELASLMRRGLSLPLDSNSPQFSLRYPVGPVATRDEIGDLLRQISKLRKVPF